MVRAFVAILILLASGIYAADLRGTRSVRAEIPSLRQLPMEIGNWVGEDLPVNETEAAVLAADTQLERRYHRADGVEVFVFVAYFAEQSVNSQIHSPRHCVPGGGWTIASIEDEELPLGGGAQPATRMRVTNARRGGDLDLYYWFRTQAGTVVGEYALKWDLVKNSLERKPTNAAFVRFHGFSEDREAIVELMGLLDEPLHGVLGEVGLR